MGGLAVGEKQLEMFRILSETTDYLQKISRDILWV